MYNADESLPITKCVQIIDYKKFTLAALDLGKKVFVMHMANLRAKISINLA